MLDTRDRFVAVSAVKLDDLCELAGRAAQHLQREGGDPVLVDGLNGAIAEVRVSSVPEP